MNPMSEFKKSFTKEYEIQGKKFLFRSLSTKETSEIESNILKKTINNSTDTVFSARKLETLCYSLVSIDDVLLINFDNVQADISSGKNEKDALRDEIGTWDDSFTSLLFFYYLDMVKQKDKQYEKETNYLSGN